MTDSWSARAHTRPGYATYSDTPAGDPTSPHRPVRPSQAVMAIARQLDVPVSLWQARLIERYFDEPGQMPERIVPAGHHGPLPPMQESAYPPDAKPLPIAPRVRRPWWRRPFRSRQEA